MEEFGKLKRETIEDIFKKFIPVEQIVEETPHQEKELHNVASNVPKEKDLEKMIKDIIDMFSHLGDGI